MDGSGQGLYVPISDYGLIGDTRTAALVSRGGSVDWMCLPNFHDPSLFARILDGLRGGFFRICSPHGEATTSRRYLPDTAVLETTFTAPDGTFRVLDFMTIDDARDMKPRLRPMRRLIRLVEALEGTPEIAVRFEPRPDYARTLPRLRRRGARAWTVEGRVGLEHTVLQTEIPLEMDGEDTLSARLRLQAGERRSMALSHSRNDIGVLQPLGDACWQELETTCDFWRGFCADCAYDGPFADEVRRSILVLRLLSFSQSGAMIAAPTMALPEAIGGGRNWDYRFCWLRDASFVIQAFLELGYDREAEAFFTWLMHSTRLTAPKLSVFYDIFGHTTTAETTLTSLEGYRASAPVHMGNDAQTQFQLDIYGEVLRAAQLYVDCGGTLDWFEQRRLRGFADLVCEQWTLPDNAIWEMRGGRRHATHSKALCFAALDAALQLCRKGALRADAKRYEVERDRIRDAIMQHAWNEERQAFMGAFGRDYLDASVLLLARAGVLSARDPKMVSTFEAIDRTLGRGAQVYRYSGKVDHFPSREGTFTACGFWAADMLARRGDLEGATARIEELLSHANDLGLMSEELDPDSGIQLGNFPQAFSHAGMINAAVTLKQAMEGQPEKEDV